MAVIRLLVYCVLALERFLAGPWRLCRRMGGAAMLPKAESACFAIADISGYTHFVSGVELDHAQDIIADIMDTLVRALRPPFRLAKFEGDAAFVYALADKIDGALIQDSIEQAYFAFRKRLRSIKQASSCECRLAAACRTSTSSSWFIMVNSSGKRWRAARSSPAGT
jgi:class 3 adenylate cyclase